MSELNQERKLDISKLLRGETDSIPFSLIFSEKAEQNGISTDSFSFSGNVSGEEKYFTIEGNISCEMESLCARCLKKVKVPFGAEVSLPVISESEESEAEDFVLIEDDKIDLFSIAYEKLIAEFPFRLLCKDDCKGICSKCGKDLNDGECGCDTREIDPRLEGLSDFFK